LFGKEKTAVWVERYEKLSNSEKEEFRRLLNLLLSKTFVIRDYYDAKEAMMRVNPEYRFIERHFELFSEYLYFSGWEIHKDNQYGVILIENIYEYNKVKLDKFSTLLIYTIRLIFEEERERVTLKNETVTTTGQIIHKMISLNIFKRKPADREIVEGLRLLSNHNIVQKISGSWESADTRILILPSILFVVSNERISRIYEMLDDEETSTQNEMDTPDLEVIRGEGEEE
jgi:hypothetical protein